MATRTAALNRPDVVEQLSLGPVGQVSVQRSQHLPRSTDLSEIPSVQQRTGQDRLDPEGAAVAQQLMITVAGQQRWSDGQLVLGQPTDQSTANPQRVVRLGEPADLDHQSAGGPGRDPDHQVVGADHHPIQSDHLEAVVLGQHLHRPRRRCRGRGEAEPAPELGRRIGQFPQHLRAHGADHCAPVLAPVIDPRNGTAGRRRARDCPPDQSSRSHRIPPVDSRVTTVTSLPG